MDQLYNPEHVERLIMRDYYSETYQVVVVGLSPPLYFVWWLEAHPSFDWWPLCVWYEVWLYGEVTVRVHVTLCTKKYLSL